MYIAFISAVLWLVGSAWQGITALLGLRSVAEAKLVSQYKKDRKALDDAVRQRQAEADEFAKEHNHGGLVGINYTDIYNVAEQAHQRRMEMANEHRRELRLSIVGWSLIAAAALLGVIATWPWG